MASFQVHMSVGIGASCSLATYFAMQYSSQISTYGSQASAVLLTLAFGLLGTLLPDVDSDTGLPVNLVFSCLAYLLTGLFAWQTFGRIPWIEWFGYSVGVWILVKFMIKKVFCKMTTHRGLHHSVPMALFWSGLVAFCCPVTLGPIRWFVGIACLVGFLIHLVLDEICSVNLIGVQVRRSFGSAFKVFPAPFWLGLFIYLLAGGFIWQTVYETPPPWVRIE